jgi:hypothetical protein
VESRNQLAVTWCAPAYVAGILVGLWLVADLLPPPGAWRSASQVADLYQHDALRIRFGLLICIGFTSLYAPFSAVISTQMLRIEGRRRPILSFVQLANGALGSFVLMLAFMIMMVAAFDPHRPPEVTKVIHEFCWICLVIPFAPFCIQYIAIAVAILQDDSPTPVFPRWVAYYNIWLAISFIPTGFVGFFKSGPFSWQGAISFWLALAAFAGWFGVMFYALRRAITLDDEESPA